MLFSATLSHRVLELAYEHMNDPELVRIEPDKMTVDRVRQVIYFPSMDEKLPLLIGLLRQMDPRRTMVFVNTRRVAERARERCSARTASTPRRSPATCRSSKRLRMLRDFHSGDLAMLIATDVASRGLHIPDVSHVFNYDLPQDAGGLRAPHRPHRARRRRGRRDQLRLRGICDVAAGHRGLHRPQGAGGSDRAGDARRSEAGRAAPAAWGRRRRPALSAPSSQPPTASHLSRANLGSPLG